MLFIESKTMKGAFDSEIGVETPKNYSIYPIKFKKLDSEEFMTIEVYINEVRNNIGGIFAAGYLLDGAQWYRVNLILSDNNKRNSILINPSTNTPTIPNQTFVEYFDRQIRKYPDILDNITPPSV